jgi:Flp pilus assembly protein TadG
MFVQRRFTSARSTAGVGVCAIRRSKRKQHGAETVEFLLTLLLFFVVFFMIIDYAITMFDKGTIINAARVGARQGSLYWVDPEDYDPTNPLDNIRMKESMVDTALDYFIDNVLINPGNQTVRKSVALDDGTAVAVNEIVHSMSGRSVTVRLNYPHRFIGLTGLLGVDAPTLQAQTGANAEANP